MNKDRISRIDAIEIVKKLNHDNTQIYDYYVSGDKDTYAESFSTICQKYKLPDYYSLSQNDRVKYGELYKNEINEEFDNLVKQCSEIIEFHNKVEKHLDDLIELEKSNFSVSEKREFNLRNLLDK